MSSKSRKKYDKDPTPYSVIPIPITVRGMIELDRQAFETHIKVPYLKINVNDLTEKLRKLKPFLLKLIKFNNVSETDDPKVKEVILNPNLIEDNCSKPEIINENDLLLKEITVGYENWKAEEILRAVLPNDVDGFSSFSRIGHILHLNLREHLNEYRFLIGQVLIDKTVGVSLVVNKVNIIESTYRNFQLEILAGDGPTVATVKENGCSYTFDFAEVYWNTRLSTEHQRIVDLLEERDVLFDVFAGVGPFALPAGKKKCTVFANDLNPHSYKWLQENIKTNKVGERVQAFNLDGREFIRTVVKENLLKIWKQNFENHLIVTPKIHIAMNLPALAVEFLDAFKGLMVIDVVKDKAIYPKVHVYTFVRGEEPEPVAKKLVRDSLGLSEDYELEYNYVRHVAPLKDMVRISLFLNDEILFNVKKRGLEEETCPDLKRICVEQEC